MGSSRLPVTVRSFLVYLVFNVTYPAVGIKYVSIAAGSRESTSGSRVSKLTLLSPYSDSTNFFVKSHG